jgi:uncharacterized protein
MAATAAVGFEQWADFLYQLGAVCGPAELHGYLVGLLAAGERFDEARWLEQAVSFLDVPGPLASTEQRAALGALYSMVLQSLTDGDYRFGVLLPDDALPLVQRSEALALWCQGFLNGLAAAGERLQQLAGDNAEALEDLAHMAQLDITEEDCEENEVYFAELVEYIKVAVLALFAELNTAASLH